MARFISVMNTLRLARNSQSLNSAMLTPASLHPLSRSGWLQTCRASVIQGRAVSGAAAGVAAEEKKLKTFKDLPGPSLLGNLYWVFLRRYLLYSHELQVVFQKKYGPMWKTSLGIYNLVNVANVDIMEQILRKEGRYPVRNDMELWKIHRRMRDYELGPFSLDGHRWQTLRSVLNTRMLRPQEAVLYTDIINEVVTDFLILLDEMRKETPSGDMVNDISAALYKMSFEGVSYILFETRIGCLQKQIPPETQKFIDSIGDMLWYTVFVSIFPQWTSVILPFWKKYFANWDNIFSFGMKLISQKMEKIQERLDRGEEVKGEYLTYLLSSGKLTDKEIHASVVELLLAGVDTTSNTLAWVLYHLSKSPDIQDQLYKEVTSLAPGDKIPTGEDTAKMPLLKAVIKETLRLYPVVSTNSRLLVEEDITIGEYNFPKGTLFTLSHYQISRDESNFPEPDKFIPQRWFRDQRVKNNAFSSIPFGYGVRACVGRRVAELEMYLLVARVIKEFELRPDPTGAEVKPYARVVLTPSKPINIQFLKRKPVSS
ncbi:sterol 26-hydroxylase, mitochondrial-like [Pelodytes ibericus]